MAAKEKAEEGGAEEKKGGGKKKMIIIIAAVVLLLAGGTLGTLYFMGMLGGGGGGEAKPAEEAKHEEAPKHDPIYFAFEQPFTVNFETDTGLRYLQVGVEMMSYDPLAVEAVKTHTPVLKNNIIMLFSSQGFDTLASREGKDKLRAMVLAEIQGVLQKYYGKPGVEEIYFTSFVMQ